MFRRGLATCIFIGMLAGSAAAADVYVRVGPPRPEVEAPPPRPGVGFVWTPGYHRWDGGRYVWVPGAWVRPPRPRAHWVRAHWVHRPRGWVLVEGHWS